jgi:hypothetical protein
MGQRLKIIGKTRASFGARQPDVGDALSARDDSLLVPMRRDPCLAVTPDCSPPTPDLPRAWRRRSDVQAAASVVATRQTLPRSQDGSDCFPADDRHPSVDRDPAASRDQRSGRPFSRHGCRGAGRCPTPRRSGIAYAARTGAEIRARSRNETSTHIEHEHEHVLVPPPPPTRPRPSSSVLVLAPVRVGVLESRARAAA